MSQLRVLPTVNRYRQLGRSSELISERDILVIKVASCEAQVLIESSLSAVALCPSSFPTVREVILT